MATVTISLPDQIALKVDAEAKNQGFSTRSEFVRSLLRKYFAGEELKFEEFDSRPIEEIKLELTKTGKYDQKFIESIINGLAKSSKYVR
ncbi:ribbon-helix-helix protein, CopG family [Patescibacteria group bacterium]|nr:ribbon-helix-helix protein, CopG family [Patescibacteria group bacterium]MBU4016349.1 ribbon-helix-helix protein, CopG family [Patescibacteria group bacterium]